jgi:phosphoglucomutase
MWLLVALAADYAQGARGGMRVLLAVGLNPSSTILDRSGDRQAENVVRVLHPRPWFVSICSDGPATVCEI